MKRFILISTLFAVSCGQADLAKSVKAVDGRDGLNLASSDPQEPCSLTQEGDKIVYRCPGKADVVIVMPKNGRDGANGQDGCNTTWEKDHNGCIWAICGETKTLVWVPK